MCEYEIKCYGDSLASAKCSGRLGGPPLGRSLGLLTLPASREAPEDVGDLVHAKRDDKHESAECLVQLSVVAPLMGQRATVAQVNLVTELTALGQRYYCSKDSSLNPNPSSYIYSGSRPR